MATYYVRPDGNDSNTGLGSTTALAWQTITKAIGATGIAPGDTLYIAPGTYRGSFTAGFTNPANEGQRITIAGNPSASLFSGVTSGPVVITNYTSNTASSGLTVLTVVKDYITIQDVLIFGYVAGGSPLFGIVADIQSTAFIATRIYCHTSEANTQSRGFQISTSGNTAGPIVSNCVFIGGFLYQGLPTSSYDSGAIIRNSIFIKTSVSSADTQAALQLLSNPGGRLGGVSIVNCSFFAGGSCISVGWFGAPSTTNGSTIRNCYFRGTTGINSTSTSIFTETYNIFECQLDRVLTNTGTGSVSRPYNPIDLHISNIQQWGILPFTAPITGSYGISAGIASGAPTADIFGVNWLAAPTIGSTESTQIVNRYFPTERNQSSVEITAGQTSRSLYLYLGATGLTATTTGLQAYYTKEDAAPVSIPLVPQTTTGAWVSGGFAEVSAANQPGVYRLDIPNTAISAGYTQTVVTVRGASGTNGAVVVIQEPPILGSQVRMGPFTVQADGVLTDERLKLFKGSIHSIDFKMVDQYGTGVDGTGTVVTANAYNSAGFLVDSYPCTAKYAEDGRYSFAIDATVTNVVGMYTINISRQIGSEINVFGRMKLEVLSP